MLSGNKYSIKPSLAEKFKGIIWKIEIDRSRPLIAVESRNAGSRTSAISLLNFETGDCLFREKIVEDSWNWSLAAVENGIVLLHSYLREGTPEHNGIIALSDDGITRWATFNKALFRVAKDTLVVYDPKMQPRKLEVISTKNGTVINLAPETVEAETNDIILPDFFQDSKIVPITIDAEIAGEIAYCHFNNKDIAVYHITVDKKYTQQLTIRQGNAILLQENLAVDVLKINPEAFFISRSHLFCIRDEKREIVSYLV